MSSSHNVYRHHLHSCHAVPHYSLTLLTTSPTSSYPQSRVARSDSESTIDSRRYVKFRKLRPALPFLRSYKLSQPLLSVSLILWAVYTGNPEIPYPDDVIALSWEYLYNVASWLLSPSQPAASLRTRHKAEMLNYSSHESLTFCEDYTTDILSA